MPLFSIQAQKIESVSQTNFGSEKELQRLVEKNLETVFNCRFVASEFTTGARHAGRIDTLALSEDNNPVIIEYKKIESSDLVNQSLFYLSWIHDHRGDFEIAVQRKLGNGIEVDWSDVRVICIAPGYKKYDLHAVQVMGANIELWRYRLYANGTVHFEEVFQTTDYDDKSLKHDSGDPAKNPVMVAAGKKAAQTRATGNYTFEEHLKGKSVYVQELALAVQEYILSIDAAIDEAPKKVYIAYKTSQNIACMEVRSRQIVLLLKLQATDVADPPSFCRDVSNIGHHGTGDAEFTIRREEDLEITKVSFQ